MSSDRKAQTETAQTEMFLDRISLDWNGQTEKSRTQCQYDKFIL